MQIENKVAAITGAARGVGRATALNLAQGGCHVAINYRSSKEEAEQTVRNIEACGVKAIAIQGDISKDADCRTFIAAVEAEFGRLDILINNAGTTNFIPHSDMEAVPDELWERIFSTNVKGIFQCCRAAKPLMDQSGGGEIISIGSVAGISGDGSSIPYCASKGAVHTMTLSLARVFAPEIRVNTIAPGFISGEWVSEGLGDDFEAAKKAKEEAAALKKVCIPQDIADAIVSIVSGSDLVTGQVLVCDGGALLAP